MGTDLERKLVRFGQVLQSEFPSNTRDYGERLELVKRFGPYNHAEIEQLSGLLEHVLSGSNHLSREDIRRTASFLLILNVNKDHLKRILKGCDEFLDPSAGIDKVAGNKVTQDSIDLGYLWRDQFTATFRASLLELQEFVEYGSGRVTLHALNGRGNEAMFMAERYRAIDVYSLDACAYNMREALDNLEAKEAERLTYDNFHLLMADARSSKQGIPFEDGSVDRIFLMGLALASPVPNEPYEILEETTRVLSKKGGILVFDEYQVDDSLQSLLDSAGLRKVFEGNFARFLYPLHIYQSD